MTDTNMLRAKMRKSMDNIGHNNGHACPPSKSNIDRPLHELFISSEAMTYWKTRFDTAKADALALGEGLDEAVEGVVKLGAGTSITLAEGELYTLTADISRPAKRLDQTALRNYLQTVLGLAKSDVDIAFDACSKLNSPAKKIKVSSR